MLAVRLKVTENNRQFVYYMTFVVGWSTVNASYIKTKQSAIRAKFFSQRHNRENPNGITLAISGLRVCFNRFINVKRGKMKYHKVFLLFATRIGVFESRHFLIVTE